MLQKKKRMKNKNQKIYFEDNGKVCVIPSGIAPRQWQHFFSNGQYAVMGSVTGAGYGVSPAIEGRFVNFYDPRDPEKTGRFVYIKNNKTGKLWNICTLPNAENNTTETRFGPGWFKIDAECEGIEASLHVTVPEEELPVEIWEISFKNNTDDSIEFSFYPYFEFFLGGAMGAQDEPEWYTKTAYSEKDNLLEATVYLPDTQKDNIIKGWMAPLYNINGYYSSKADFFGNGTLAAPDAIATDSISMSSGESFGEKTIGVFKREVTLQSEETTNFTLIIGRADSNDERNNILAELKKKDAIPNIRKNISNYWNDIYSRNKVSTPDPDFDRWVNVWLKYQEVQAIRCGNGISANSPLMGFRDMLQHAAGNALIESESAKNLLLEALQYQYANGRAVRQWSRKGKHDTRDYRDSPVWIIHALTLYLKETANFTILEKIIPFLDKGSGTVMEHAETAIKCLLDDLGEHGLSHIGGGDWLDPLTACGITGRGESTMLTMQLIEALNEMALLYEVLNLKNKAVESRQYAKVLKKAVEKHSWDGNWYIRAFDDNGRPIGGKESGRMFITPQVFSVISGCAPDERLKDLFQKVDENLGTDYGYMLYSPPYPEWDSHVGNASILQLRDMAYCHGSAFKIFADTIRGNGNAAYESFKRVCPENPKNHFTTSGAEPHIIPNGYCGPTHRYPGKVMYSGFSGTFNWLLRGAIERICGVRADYSGLIIDPCLPDGWNNCSVSRTIRNQQFDININRTTATKYEIAVNGQKLDGNRLDIT